MFATQLDGKPLLPSLILTVKPKLDFNGKNALFFW